MSIRTRKQRLIKPGLQLRFGFIFLATSVGAVLIHAFLLNWTLTQVSHKLPNDESILLAQWPGVFSKDIIFAIGLMLPMTLVIGVLSTFPIAGAIYRIESHLRDVIRGTNVGPCKLRKGDQLQELCGLMNQALGYPEPVEAGSEPEMDVHVDTDLDQAA